MRESDLRDKIISLLGFTPNYGDIIVEPVSDPLFAQYNLSHFDPGLDKIFLSPRAVVVQAGTAAGYTICQKCETDLVRNVVPEFAIANGNFGGVLPTEFHQENRTTLEMVSKWIPSMWIRTIHGGNAKKLESHVYAFRNHNDTAIAEQLPRSLETFDHIKCTVIGNSASVASARAKTAYSVNLPNMWRLFHWFQENNIHYEKTPVNASVEKEGIFTAPISHIENNEAVSDAIHVDPRHHEHPEGADDPDIPESEQTRILMDLDGYTNDRDVIDRLVIRRGNSLMSERDPMYAPYGFPHLLPFGRGGIGEPRRKRWSLDKWTKYVLNLSHGRFASDVSFILTFIDLKARQRAFRSTYLKVSMKPDIAQKANDMTSDQLHDFLDNQDERRKAMLCNKPLPPYHPSPVSSVLTGITTGMASFFGSAEERAQIRKQAYAMTAAFGQSNIFFTICPNAFNCLQVHLMNGEYPAIFDIDGVNRASGITLAQVDAINSILSKKEMHSAATDNPINAAKYFNDIIECIIEDVFSWDTERHSSKEKPGLFGYTRGFIGCVEAQNSSNLHVHFMVWVCGMPRTCKEYTEKIAEPAFREQVQDYAASIISSESPLEIPLTCPRCNVGGLSPVTMDGTAYRRYRSGDKEPIAFECTHAPCTDKVFTTTEIFQDIINSNGHAVTKEEIDRVAQNIKPIGPTSGQAGSRNSIVLSLILHTEQTHSWKHCSSCYKKSQRNKSGCKCRFMFPKMVVGLTHVSDQGRVHLQRRHGHQWLNSYSELLTRLLKVNHDIKLLTCGEGPAIVYYCLAYSTKSQKKVESMIVLYMNAYERARKTQDAHADQRTGQQKGAGIIYSMLGKITNPQEMCCSMASLYHIRGSPFYVSHDFAPVAIDSVLAELDGTVDKQVSVTYDATRATFTSKVSSIVDYMQRPDILESICFHDFVKTYEKVKRIPKKNALLFRNTHSQVLTHSLIRRRTRNVLVNILGKRFANLDTERTADEKQRYEQSLLVLFRPFRLPAELNQPDTFATWPMTAQATRFSLHNQDYFDSRETQRSYQDPEEIYYNEQHEDSGNNSDYSDNDSVHSGYCSGGDDEERNESYTQPLEDTYDGILRHDSCEETLHYHLANNGLPPNTEAQDNFLESKSLQEMREKIKRPTVASSQDQGSVHVSMGLETPQETIQVIVQACQDTTWTPVTVASPVTTKYASFKQISRHFRLNEKQHLMFLKSATSWARTVARETGTLETDLPQCLKEVEQQFVGLLIGPAGYGKSEVFV